MCVDWRGVVVVADVVVVVVVVVADDGDDGGSAVVGVANDDVDDDDVGGGGATMMTSSCHIDEVHSNLPSLDRGHSLDPSIARYSDIHCCDSGYWSCCSHR